MAWCLKYFCFPCLLSCVEPVLELHLTWFLLSKRVITIAYSRMHRPVISSERNQSVKLDFPGRWLKKSRGRGKREGFSPGAAGRRMPESMRSVVLQFLPLLEESKTWSNFTSWKNFEVEHHPLYSLKLMPETDAFALSRLKLIEFPPPYRGDLTFHLECIRWLGYPRDVELSSDLWTTRTWLSNTQCWQPGPRTWHHAPSPTFWRMMTTLLCLLFYDAFSDHACVFLCVSMHLETALPTQEEIPTQWRMTTQEWMTTQYETDAWRLKSKRPSQLRTPKSSRWCHDPYAVFQTLCWFSISRLLYHGSKPLT